MNGSLTVWFDQETKSICVYLEVDGDRLAAISLELIAKGREVCDQLGWQLVGLLLGDEVSDLTAEGFAHGLDEIWLGDDPLLEYFTIEAYTLAAHQSASWLPNHLCSGWGLPQMGVTWLVAWQSGCALALTLTAPICISILTMKGWCAKCQALAGSTGADRDGQSPAADGHSSSW